MIRVGPAGWSYGDWEGIVYPKKKPRGFHPLGYLARYVTCIEVNSSFYAAPRAEYAARWAQEVETHAEFRFSVKLQDVFTHRTLPAAAEREALAHAWLGGIEPLRASGKLAAVLVQFPVSFHAGESERERLGLIENMFGHLPLVLEVRHRSWFRPESLASIEGLGYSLAHIDLPHAKDHPPAGVSPLGPIGYLRVHGRNRETWFAKDAGRDQRYNYLYSPREVEGLVQETRRIASSVDETLVVTNNHFAGKAVANALEILASLHNTKPRAPIELTHAYPRLLEIAQPEGQDVLF